MTTVIKEFSDFIAHYGTPRRSGRYPWGSGGNAYQRSISFLGVVEELQKEGMTPSEIAKANGITQTELRQLKTIAKNEVKAARQAQALRLQERGWSNGAIAERMGLAGESSVRALLEPAALDKTKILNSTTDMLRDQIEKKKYLDVGAGEYLHMGVSENNFKTALKKLETEGYKIHYVPVKQLGTGLNTSQKVMAAPGVPYSEVWANRDKIKIIADVYSEDGGRSWLGIEPPTSINSKRIAINYKEDGGDKADGVIYIRPGVKDLSLGGNKYAQVRIAVDDTHYMKGMAVYKDDLPKGVDLVFNTTKSKTTAKSKLDVLKPMEKLPDGSIDWDNPFGTSISRQSGVMNMVGSPNKPGAGEEGSWATWAKTLSSQFLSKQSPKLAETQLAMTRERRENELDEILRLTNPVVRQHLLLKLAESTDSAAVHLKAAEMRGQSNHVILPIQSMKKTEVFSPTHNNGDNVVLIRFPHGGRFEIPELIVNNRNREARKTIGSQSIDAIGIHPDVAKRLSGADFDGDTVLVIPNTAGRIKTAPPLQGLKDFDPIAMYPKYDGMKPMRNTNVQMGEISNLINDMTLKGASSEELARAVRHSMVVIDAEKHELNYRQSFQDNGIRQLRERYQPSASGRGGASTIISRKKREIEVPERRQGYKIDPDSGKRIYTPSDNKWVDKKTGEPFQKMQRVKWLDETDDAHELRSGEPIVMERIYADHSNSLKALANRARREAVNTKTTPRSSSARVAYKSEVESLEAKLQVAQMNAPRERHAQVLANAHVRLRRQAKPNMTPAEIKKVETQALAEMRTRVGAKKAPVEITPSEWAAIQAGAISPSKLRDILKNTDLDQVKEYATPKSNLLMSPTTTARAKQMLAQGYTQAEVASQLGVSVSTLTRGLT